MCHQVKAWADRNKGEAGANPAGTTNSPPAPVLDDEDEFQENKSCAKLMEEHSFAIESCLYFLFLVLFTVYAVSAQGDSHHSFAMGEQVSSF